MKSQNFSLGYPFRFKENVYTDLIEEQAHVWIDSYTSLPEDERLKYKKSHFGIFAANFYPEANFEQLVPICRWILACFIFDDYYGSYRLPELEKICQKMNKIFEGNSAELENEEFLKLFAIGRKEFLPIVSQYWMERFINHNCLWLEAMKTETFYNHKQELHYPLIEEYISIREDVSGGKVMCDFLEIVSGFIMPEEIFLHPTIVRLRQLISLMMCWCNDIHCYFWELKRKEAMNLVLVIKNEKQCSLDVAFNDAVQIHTDNLAEFLDITKNLPDFGTYNQSVEKYIHNAGLLLKGHEMWYGQTMRYIQSES